MTTIIALYVTATTALETAAHRAVARFEEDKGQTTMEWMGIAAIVVAILAITLQAAPTLGELVRSTWERLFNSATGSGA